jgi:hypothetical protein
MRHIPISLIVVSSTTRVPSLNVLRYITLSSSWPRRFTRQVFCVIPWIRIFAFYTIYLHPARIFCYFDNIAKISRYCGPRGNELVSFASSPVLPHQSMRRMLW